ncbi:PKD domain-containing protein [Mucilaginibacter terrenus]|uniref:PKD domain-containing protein n=1 Tax=Mucilaginibacter terrenus TaxID=2482727 RepID=A0A3E2NXK5_9SPHI|nr:PQQ-dependent sugar dehydrogenase [Mucilaginibacter terrenus]RFZ85748.1 PKD domain-containing protein [Mucilaginibacter terrenus]
MFKTFTLFKALPAVLLLSVATITLHAQTPKKPEENRFTKVVLAQDVQEPMQFQIMKDGRVVYAERKGKIKVYDPATNKIAVIGEFAVSTKYVNKKGEVSEGEDGMQGVILDPDYETNHWIYLYYAPAGDVAKNTLERYVWLGKEILLNTKKTILDVPTQREECCHVGGGMLFDKDKNLYLSTGDNTFSRASDGFTPLDERPGMSPEDSQKSSSNTNDLRGKILRIHPQADGTYTIPAGNLFPPGTPKTKPEIYTMGNRNPWRLTIDSKTGWLYWGEVGPDGSKDDFEKRGPQSYDEFNQAKKPGNYGWPYFVGDNKAYRKYDFATKQSGDFFNAEHPENHSPNSSGLVELPPATPAFIWYAKGISEKFPLMESGGNSAVGGPIFRRADFKNPKRPFPEYYEGKWLITDWVRGWINVVEIDENGNYKSMERFLPELKLRGPIDMKFGPEGDLYVLEYGNGYFRNNPEAELIRIEFNGGNRRPQVQAAANKTAGSVPFKVNLSSAGTKDFDDDDVLSYTWAITKNGKPYKTLKEQNPSVTFTTPGVYKATLTVADLKGLKNSQAVTIKAGNEPPVVAVNITKGNSSFFFPGKTVTYKVNVNDKEDGSLANKRISPSQVSVSVNYLSEGYNMTAIAQKQQGVDASAKFAAGMALINKSDCRSCHAVKEKLLGPAFISVAKKYKNDPNAVTYLSKKIKTGGSGVWGDAAMPAHPALSANELNSVVRYIMSTATPQKAQKSMPVSGTYVTAIPKGDNENGSFIFRAAYTDKGTGTVAPILGENIVVLRGQLVPVKDVSETHNMVYNRDSTVAVVKDGGAWVKFAKTDLSGIKNLELALIPRGRGTDPVSTIELRSGAPDGKVIKSFTGSYNGLQKLTLDLPDGLGVTDLYLVFTGTPLRFGTVKFNND